jgi:hypothetical protein
MTMPKPRVRRSTGSASDTQVKATGAKVPAAAPCATRAARYTGHVGLSATTTDVAASIASPASSTGRRPYPSAIGPAASSPIANATAKKTPLVAESAAVSP